MCICLYLYLGLFYTMQELFNVFKNIMLPKCKVVKNQ